MSAEGIGKAPAGRPGHGIDGEIPAGKIFPDIRHEFDPIRMPVVSVAAFGAEGGDLHHTLRSDHTHSSVLFSGQYQIVVGKEGFRLLRQSSGAEIIVLGSKPQQHVPYAASNGISGKTGCFQPVDQRGYKLG